MLTNPPVLYDFCVGNPISCLLTVGSTQGINVCLLCVRVMDGEHILFVTTATSTDKIIHGDYPSNKARRQVTGRLTNTLEY